jgi:hypothetical protein
MTAWTGDISLENRDESRQRVAHPLEVADVTLACTGLAQSACTPTAGQSADGHAAVGWLNGIHGSAGLPRGAPRARFRRDG